MDECIRNIFCINHSFKSVKVFVDHEWFISLDSFCFVPNRSVSPCVWTAIWTPGTPCPEHTTPDCSEKELACELSSSFPSSGCCTQRGPMQCSAGGPAPCTTLPRSGATSVTVPLTGRAQPVDCSHNGVSVDSFYFALRNSSLPMLNRLCVLR